MKVRIEVTAADVRAEAERRIVARYPLWKQINLQREGGDALAAMTTFIDGIRACSNRIEELKRIPANYREDRHWQ